MPVIDASTPLFVSLHRSGLKLQARYIQTSPFCDSSQLLTELGINVSLNGYASIDEVYSPYSKLSFFEYKYESDSLAPLLDLSNEYYTAHPQLDFFRHFQCISAVPTVLNVANAMRDTAM